EHLVIELGIISKQGDGGMQRLLRDVDPEDAAICVRVRRQSWHCGLQALQLEGEFFHGQVFRRSYSYSYSYSYSTGFRVGVGVGVRVGTPLQTVALPFLLLPWVMIFFWSCRMP